MEIQKAKFDQLNRILEIFSYAREFMKNNGNPSQWGDHWPSEEKIVEDINNGIGHVIIDDDNEVIGYFALIFGIDPTYLNIWDGQWISDDPYITVHRLASSGKKKGIFPFVVNYLKQYKTNIRVDTHENNKFMIHQSLKCGFKYCGHISPIEGGDRLAFEWIFEE